MMHQSKMDSRFRGNDGHEAELSFMATYVSFGFAF
jgi:hypothetical protein